MVGSNNVNNLSRACASLSIVNGGVKKPKYKPKKNLRPKKVVQINADQLADLMATTRLAPPRQLTAAINRLSQNRKRRNSLHVKKKVKVKCVQNRILNRFKQKKKKPQSSNFKVGQ